jgi:hypothetical protein
MGWDVLQLKIVFMVVIATFLLGLFAGLLFYVWEVKRNRWMISICALFIVSNIFLLVQAYGEYDYYAAHDPAHGDFVSNRTIWVMGIAAGASDGCWSFAHYLLSQQYKAMSRRIPRMISGEKE